MEHAVHELAQRRQDRSARGSHATNVTYAAMDPFFAMIRFLDSKMAPPVSNNWGFINEPEYDKLAAAVRVAFDPAERDKALAALHERSVDEAAFLFVAHDVGPRAMTPKIKGFVQPKSWFVDFSTMTMNWRAIRSRAARLTDACSAAFNSALHCILRRGQRDVSNT